MSAFAMPGLGQISGSLGPITEPPAETDVDPELVKLFGLGDGG